MLNATVSVGAPGSRAIRGGSVPVIGGHPSTRVSRLAAAQYTRLARLAVWTGCKHRIVMIAGLAAIVARSSSSIHSGLGLRATLLRISSRIRGEG